ncbi:3'-5' exonuclease [Herbaspirillum sp. RV1423]|uniref:3'-5' exonuclease n=1 Tax=Herbaspirillum sp. RV1423 TaxID=1443993 RepID=UPI0004B749E5|nr:3'-5' exonuclease [Herbaspirillum sp. RV1423]
MTKELIYDTETTGLPVWSQPSDHPDQPRVIELAAELIDTDSREVIACMSFIIKPEGWTIPPEITTLTGISNELANAVGVPMKMVLPCFMALWAESDRRVAHNESFDMRMIRIELMRAAGYQQFADEWKAAPAFCTQASSTNILNLPPTEKMRAKNMKGPKSPNLSEAYEFFTGQKFEGAHRASADVAACRTVFFGIRDRQPELQPA